MQITQSELKTFKRCRRRWWLEYYRRLALKAQKASGASAIGTKVHFCLERYYGYQEDPLAQLDFLVEQDVALWPEQEVELRKDGNLCHIMLEGYLEWLAETGADADLEILGTEQVVEVPFTEIAGEPVSLRAKLDMRVRRRSTGFRAFMDHKTVPDLTSPLRTLHLDEQLLHYHLTELLQFMEQGATREEAEQERSDGGIYNMLRKVKRTAKANPPFYAREEVRHNIHELRSYWQRVCGEAAEIIRLRQTLDNGGNPVIVCYPTPIRDCAWDCQFFAVCSMFDDGSDVEPLLGELYEERDPQARYALLSGDSSQVEEVSFSGTPP